MSDGKTKVYLYEGDIIQGNKSFNKNYEIIPYKQQGDFKLFYLKSKKEKTYHCFHKLIDTKDYEYNKRFFVTYNSIGITIFQNYDIVKIFEKGGLIKGECEKLESSGLDLEDIDSIYKANLDTETIKIWDKLKPEAKTCIKNMNDSELEKSLVQEYKFNPGTYITKDNLGSDGKSHEYIWNKKQESMGYICLDKTFKNQAELADLYMKGTLFHNKKDINNRKACSDVVNQIQLSIDSELENKQEFDKKLKDRGCDSTEIKCFVLIGIVKKDIDETDVKKIFTSWGVRNTLKILKSYVENHINKKEFKIQLVKLEE